MADTFWLMIHLMLALEIVLWEYPQYSHHFYIRCKLDHTQTSSIPENIALDGHVYLSAFEALGKHFYRLSSAFAVQTPSFNLTYFPRCEAESAFLDGS